MKKFKTIITATIVGALAMSSFVACSSDDSKKEETKEETTVTTTEAETEATEADDDTYVGCDIDCNTDLYYGLDIEFETKVVADDDEDVEDVEPAYVDSESEDSKVVVFTPSEEISDIIFVGVSTEPYDGWYTFTSCPEELAHFESADEENPIVIRMDLTDGNPSRAIEYRDSSDSYHIAIIQYDSETGEFQIKDVQAMG